MRKLTTLLLILLLAASSFLTKAQNQVSKDSFFKSLSLDPLLTLHNSTNNSVSCIFIDYKINGKELSYKFEGTLPAMTSVEVPLPRIQVQNGLHFFDASVRAKDGKLLNGLCFAEGFRFTLSPGNEASLTTNSLNSHGNRSEEESGCSCQNNKGFNEDISFWFSTYINDSKKLDAFASIDRGLTWVKADWEINAGLENQLNTATFKDQTNRNRTFELAISTSELPENELLTADNEGGFSNDILFADCKAYPNPFKDHVFIEYTIKKNCELDISICDLSGRILNFPVKAVPHATGRYTYKYNTSDLTPGLYYCVIRSGDTNRSLKLMKK